jgi:DNA-binding CsgD family transcriptional regulator/tetratricopeptide (TPR) repeat protein
VTIAAVAGSKVDHRLLSAVSDLDDDALHASVAEAVERGVLVVDDGRFAFRHALQRDAIADAMLPTDRARLHGRLAVELTANPELSVAGPAHTDVELAAHWWEAGEWKHARDTSITAAHTMAALLALPEASAHYDRALAANDRVADTDRLDDAAYLDLVEAAADAAYFGASTEHSCELWQLALDLVDAEAEPERAAVFQARLARNTFLLGGTERAFHLFRSAAEMIPADPPSVELARVLALQARCLLLMARFHDAADLAQEAIAVARGADARAEEGHALDTYGMCLGLFGDLDGGIAAVRDALTIAEELGIPDNLNLGYTHLSLLLLIAGRLEAAAGVALDGAAMGEALGGIRLNGAAVNSAQALISLGRTDEALALLQDLGDLVGNCKISPPLLRLAIAVRRGDHDLAAELAPQLETLTEGLVEIDFRGVFQAIVAELALNEGRPEDAQRSIDTALAMAAGSENPYQVELSALALRTIADGIDDARVRTKRPDVDKARLLATERLGAVDEFVERPDSDVMSLPAVVAWRATARAEHSRLYEPDAELWADAAVLWDELSQPYESAYCRWREADALLHGRGGRPRATQCLQEARRLATQMGAGSLVVRIERLAQRARLTLTDTDPDDGTQPLSERVAEDLDITPREVEVLDQLARGRTDRQIADQLFISRKTASVHVSNILGKLGVSSRGEAAAVAHRLGLHPAASPTS